MGFAEKLFGCEWEVAGVIPEVRYQKSDVRSSRSNGINKTMDVRYLKSESSKNREK